MKANELRVGNYVLHNRYICDVYSIQSPKPYKDKRFDGKFIIDLFDGGGLITAILEEIKPIPLTEEILLKCGAEKVGTSTNVFELDPFSLRKVPHYQFWYVRIDHDIRISKIKYLHELQNLYFVFHGKELTVDIDW